MADITSGQDVDILSSVLPTGAATSSNQTDGSQKTIIVDSTGADLDLWHTGDTFTAAADHGIVILAVSSETPNKYRPLNIEVSEGDGESNTRNRLSVETTGHTYNGSTWDMARSIINATNSLGTGIAAVGLVAQLDDTSPTTITENQFGNVRMSSRRALLVEGVASGTALGVSVASGGIASGAIASGAVASGAIASGAVASGAFAAGSIAVGAITAGDTSIATTEDTARAAGEHLVKVGISRLDTPVANAGVGTDGDYTNIIADNFGKVWISGSVPEDVAHVAGESILREGSRRIDTLATSAGTSGDWATVNQTAEGAAWATLAPTAIGGLTIIRDIDLDESSPANIKNAAGVVYGWEIFNASTTTRYVKLYNKASAPVIANDTPVITIGVGAGQSARWASSVGISFGTGIGWLATTGVADTNTGAPAANDVVAQLYYL